jgi:hypothetical protein
MFVPEFEERRGQHIRPVFGQEKSSVFDFNNSLRAGYGVLEPVRPFYVEEKILESPNDTIIEAEKTLVFHNEGNTFPNQEGVDTKRFISIDGDEFRWTTPDPSVGGKSEAVWKAR